MNADDVRRAWADRAAEFSPTYYAYRGPDDASEAVREVLDRRVGPGAAVLELGCSAGRHLEHLRRHGYDDLHGLDVNDESFAVMAAEYPDLAEAVTPHHGAMEALLGDLDAGAFDAVFAVETLQHVHPDEAWVFAEIARIAGGVLVTVECEGSAAAGEGPDVTYENGDLPLYYRAWDRIFGDLGLAEFDSAALGSRTLRAFDAA